MDGAPLQKAKSPERYPKQTENYVQFHTFIGVPFIGSDGGSVHCAGSTNVDPGPGHLILQSSGGGAVNCRYCIQKASELSRAPEPSRNAANMLGLYEFSGDDTDSDYVIMGRMG